MAFFRVQTHPVIGYAPGMPEADLVVFVTELARRQYLRRTALDKGFVDASRFLTFTRVRSACIEAARAAGHLAQPVLSDIALRILILRAVEAARPTLAPGGRLNSLTDIALADTLATLTRTLAPFGEEAGSIHHWLLEQPPATKLHQLGQLYSVYRDHLAASHSADMRDVNAAVLRLLQGDRSQWPQLLQSPSRIVFRSLRWLNPFEERLIAALKRGLGADRVILYSALPPAHAEKVEDRLASRVRSEVMMGSEDAWSGWAEDLGDAMEMEDTSLALGSSDRISFSRSVGLYGEVEDLARRIRWEIDVKGVAPDHIALVVRNLSNYADAVTHVFARFGIPCFFRRGLPISSAPLVKTFLSLLSLPLGSDRERFCALLQNASLVWPKLKDPALRAAIAHDIRAAAVPPRVTPDTLRRRLRAYYGRHPESETRARFVDVVAEALTHLRGLTEPASFTTHARRAIKLAADFRIEPSTWAPEGLPQDILLGNRRAFEAVLRALSEIADATQRDDKPRSLSEFFDLLEQCIENLTVSPGHSTESGVWVMNPFDTAGLHFEVVLIGGLNEGEFPALPRQDSVFGDAERDAIRVALKQKGIDLPQWALPLSTVRIIEEKVLFLISVGAARQRLVLSYQSANADGQDLVPGNFFRSLWNIAGGPASRNAHLTEYDAWRIAVLGPDSYLARYITGEAHLAEYQRSPIPGESFLATIPLPLCRAADEARQRIARSIDEPNLAGEIAPWSTPRPQAKPMAPAQSLLDRLTIELGREDFFNSPPSARKPSEPYCGLLRSNAGRELATEWLRAHAEVSPTGLENLARCRYRFLLGAMFRLGAIRTQEDEPDAADRGNVIHDIMEAIYRALTGDAAVLNQLDPATAKQFSAICTPLHWAVRQTDGTWQLHDSRPTGERSLPLATLQPARQELYVELVDAVCGLCFALAEAPASAIRLGDPGIWGTEKPKIRQIALNYMLADLATACDERRYPALFEHRFGRQFDRAEPDAPPLTLRDDIPVCVHGQIDRVDLIFGEDRRLSHLLVIDYKGSSRGHKSLPVYAEEISENLNCQLPIYAFAAQEYFFGTHNEPAINALTSAVYHVQDRDLKKVMTQLAKKRIPLTLSAANGLPISESFLSRLAQNISRLADADFSVDPLDCTYCDFKHICRVDVRALEGAAAADGGDAR